MHIFCGRIANITRRRAYAHCYPSTWQPPAIFLQLKTLTTRQLRALNRLLDQLFSVKSFIVPPAFKNFSGLDFLARELRLSDNRQMWLSDRGMALLRDISTALDRADLFDGLAGYSDVAGGCRQVVQDWLSKWSRPDGAGEFVELVRQAVEPQICRHTFVVSLYGVELDGIDSIVLGSFRVVRPSAGYLTASGVNFDMTTIQRNLKAMESYLWLVGDASGTCDVAERKFTAHAELIVGMLAVSAASMHEYGASGFRIGVVMSPEQAYGRSVWMLWTDKKKSLVTSAKFVGSQSLQINQELVEQLRAATVFDRSFAIFESGDNSPLEAAIKRAVYWYSDAHRDSVPVMKLVKYWSCVETFFSGEKSENGQAVSQSITSSVSIGLACVLVFGGFQFVPEKEYAGFKARIRKLYDLRSRAVHGAVHHHVSVRDTAELSQWVAWMLINMIAFVERGYKTPEQIKSRAEELDATVRESGR